MERVKIMHFGESRCLTMLVGSRKDLVLVRLTYVGEFTARIGWRCSSRSFANVGAESLKRPIYFPFPADIRHLHTCMGKAL